MIAGAGMCNGGRILHHFKHHLWRSETAVLLVGTGLMVRTVAHMQQQDLGFSTDGVLTMGVHLPVIEAHDVQTRLTVDHGETIVLGGLLRDGQMTIEQGVPYLRDIPLISKLLAPPRDIGDTDKVIILVTPRLVNYND